MSQYSGPVILDEIQFAPELLAYLKIKVDQSDARGQYFLTCSENSKELRGLAEEYLSAIAFGDGWMAGRAVVIEMAPMTVFEVLQTFSFDALQTVTPRHWLECYLADPQQLSKQSAGVLKEKMLTQALWRGGFPGVVDEQERWFKRYFEGYLKTYIDRDVRTMADVEQLMKFEHFVALLAALTAREINYTELGREIDAHGQTARRWLEIMRATYLWHDVAPFVGNTIKRVTKKTKGYFIDTGFACQLLRIASPDQLLGHPAAGFLFETYIFNMLSVVRSTLPFATNVYHWHSDGGAEVDLVIEYGNALYPIEIKMKSLPNGNDARGLKAFRETYKNGPMRVMPGVIIYAGTDCYWLDHDVLAVPWNLVMRDQG